MKNWSTTVKHDKLNFDSPQGLVMVGGNIQSINYINYDDSRHGLVHWWKHSIHFNIFQPPWFNDSNVISQDMSRYGELFTAMGCGPGGSQRVEGLAQSFSGTSQMALPGRVFGPGRQVLDIGMNTFINHIIEYNIQYNIIYNIIYIYNIILYYI